MTDPAIVALTRAVPDALVLATAAGLVPSLGPLFPSAVIVYDLDGLRAALDAQAGPSMRLISIGFAHIVPADLLLRCRAGAVNLHPAPPEYPGSAANHLALYEGATRFGVTAHIMIASVDAGPILAVDHFAIPPGAGHRGLDLLTLPAVIRMATRLAPCLAGAAPWPAPPQERWRGPANRRADILALAQVTPDLDAAEVHRRWRAFRDGPDSILTYWIDGTPQPYRPQGRIIGWVDGIIGPNIQGWAYDAGRGPVRLRVEIDEQPFTDLIATGFRGDVAAAGHGDGSCGFHLPLADLPNGARRVEFLLPDDEWRRLPGGPVTRGEAGW